MKANGILVNLAMILVALIFLTIPFGAIAAYNAFRTSNDPNAAPEQAQVPTPIPAKIPTTVAPTVAITQLPASNNCTNNATFIADVSIPNGSVLQPQEGFEKTWRVLNNGTCPWTNGYQLVFIGGSQMGAPKEIDVPNTLPGATTDLKIDLKAPNKTGSANTQWQLRGPRGDYFGAKLNTTINVSTPTTSTCNGIPKIESFFAVPNTISGGQTSSLNWGFVSNADTAEIDNGIGGIPTPGNITVSPKTTTTYTLTAYCGTNVAQAQVTITLQ